MEGRALLQFGKPFSLEIFFAPVFFASLLSPFSGTVTLLTFKERYRHDGIIIWRLGGRCKEEGGGGKEGGRGDAILPAAALLVCAVMRCSTAGKLKSKAGSVWKLVLT